MKIPFSEAISLIDQGEPIVFPTETVYGIGVTYTSQTAIDRLYSIKKRPLYKPCTLHISSLKQISTYIDTWPPYTKELIDHFWPGPLTLILPVSSFKTTHMGIRMPNHPTALQLIGQTGPLLVSSVNHSGKPPCISYDEITTIFGPLIPILDTPPYPTGIPSTILMYESSKWHCKRIGLLPLEKIYPIVHGELSISSL